MNRKALDRQMLMCSVQSPPLLPAIGRLYNSKSCARKTRTMMQSPGGPAAFPEVTLDDIRAAAARIKGAVARTPSHWSRTLSRIVGCEVHLKFENLQFTSSFKERGALNKLLSLSPEERHRGVAAMSAGNHAQGVAYHAGRLGIPATIVMPEGTPQNKIKHTRNFGATVILQGRDLKETDAAARALAAQDGLTFIHPYDD